MFREILFPICISYDAIGGPYWPTDVVRLKSGVEHRNQPWSHPVRKYSVDLTDHTKEDMLEFVEFWENQQGTEYGFRWKDWVDFTSGTAYDKITDTDEEIGVGDGTETAFQLRKTYPGGSSRPIYKPVHGTLLLSLDNVTFAGVAVYNTVNGMVHFENAPGNGVVARAGFEYDMPVRFSDTSVGFDLRDFRRGNISSLDIEEMRIDPEPTSPAMLSTIQDYFDGNISASALPSNISVF